MLSFCQSYREAVFSKKRNKFSSKHTFETSQPRGWKMITFFATYNLVPAWYFEPKQVIGSDMVVIFIYLSFGTVAGMTSADRSVCL